LFADNYNGVWAGLDNGLAFFTYNDAIKHINPAVFNNGTGYDVKFLQDDLYFALSTGLFSLSASSATDLSSLTQEPQTILEGLTWNLSTIDKQLLAGRDNGLFLINNKQASPIAQSTGYWACRPIPQTANIIAGNYLGAQFFEMNNQTLKDIGNRRKSYLGIAPLSRYLSNNLAYEIRKAVFAKRWLAYRLG
jgi:hypothetical protein